LFHKVLSCSDRETGRYTDNPWNAGFLYYTLKNLFRQATKTKEKLLRPAVRDIMAPVDVLTIFFAVVMGWLGGILVNYLADVLPYRRKLTKPFCLQCGAEAEPVGWFLWPRRCPECGKRRSSRTWIVEGVMTAAVVWLWLSPQPQVPFLAGWALLVYFGVVVVIDIEYHLILGPVSYAGIVLAGLLGFWMRGWQATLLGGLAGFGFMFVIYWMGIAFMRFQARRRGVELAPGDEEAMGFGDVSLSGVLGLLLGWPGVVMGLLLAIFTAAGVSLLFVLWMLIRRRYQLFAAIPYGPFLVAGAVLALFFRNSVSLFINWVF
jgi:leader peptidase (prepilin peptidase) / N-methyltransferase